MKFRLGLIFLSLLGTAACASMLEPAATNPGTGPSASTQPSGTIPLSATVLGVAVTSILGIIAAKTGAISPVVGAVEGAVSAVWDTVSSIIPVSTSAPSAGPASPVGTALAPDPTAATAIAPAASAPPFVKS